MKKLFLLMVAAAAFSAAFAEGVSLVPTNVTVKCAAGDLTLAKDGGKWSAGAVEVEFAADGRLLLKSPALAVSKIAVRFAGAWPVDHGIRHYRDGWERTGGTAGWYPITKGRGTFCPWYTLIKRGDVTDGVGVMVQPNAFVCWTLAADGLELLADVRAGADGVELGARALEVCRLVTRRGVKGEGTFAAARAFAKLMCPNGRLPKEPVYGYNDWYCAYGKNTATNFLADAAYVSACAKGLKSRPYVVMDDGWQLMSPPEIQRRTGKFESGRGPWNESSTAFGMGMKEFTAKVAALDAKPGLWYRPFRAWDGTDAAQLVLNDQRFFDPSLPEMDARIRADIGRFRAWGMKLVKIDYLAYDAVRAWESEMRETPLKNPPKWHRRDRTAAEVVRTLYRTMREAAGDDMVIIGCNAFNHFAAGLFELQRTGNDTSGRDWKWTVVHGVNTLAMRAHQDGIFFSVDADCAGLAWKGAVDWAKNRQWIDLLGRSGTAVFVSWFRDLADAEVRRTIAAAYARSAAGIPVGEPLDWTETHTPSKWRFSDGTVKTYDWQAVGGDVDALAALLPRPVKVERREGSCDAALAARNVKTMRYAVADAPADVADQAYILEIAPDGVAITAASAQGERYARVTLDQLAKLGGGDLPCCRIVDWPALKWRGFMNDCGRNFLEFAAVKEIIDEMARVKMNLFHWHLTEYHGWRLESKKYPGLQKPEAFRRQVGKYYTQDEFRELVRYAGERGITVMPELDVPGHSLALRVGLGIETMADPKARTAVAELIEELCSLAPADVMPFIHLGTDEARQLPEYCDGEYVSHWARTVNRCGRRAVVWAPGIKLAKDVDAIDMAWYDDQITNSANAYFDSARMYNGSWNPFLVPIKSATVKPCRWQTDPKRMLGALTCTWHDDNVGEDTRRLFNDAMVMPSIAAFGDNYWCGDREDLPEYSGVKGPWKMPDAGSAAFARIVELEGRLAAHRDYVLKGVDVPFPFLRQTDLSWKLVDAKGRTVAEDVRGGAFDLRAYASPKDGTITAETVITSRTDCVVGAWIDFTFYGCAYSRNASLGTPKIGQWSCSGAKVFVNGAEILPPVWENPGAKATFARAVDNPISWGDDLCEQPYHDEGPTRRPFTSIRLKKGENRVKLVIPPGGGGPVWGALFAPALGTSTHPREL